VPPSKKSTARYFQATRCYRKKYCSPCRRHKGIYGSRCIAPPILNAGTGWRWVLNFTPLPHDAPKRKPVPVNRCLCGPQSLYVFLAEQKILLPLPGFELQIVQSVAKWLY
jgi:hypothetical protein